MPDDALAKAAEALRQELERRLCTGCTEKTTWHPDDPEPPACVLTCRIGAVLEHTPDLARAVLEAARADKALEVCRAVEAMEAERQEVRAKDGRPDDLWVLPPDPKWYRHVLRLAREALGMQEEGGETYGKDGA